MRILIITHPRSGGKSLLDWISKETGYHGYHEPALDDKDLMNIISTRDNILVKTFPFFLHEHNINIEEFSGTFDKVICHVRENILDVAISLSHANQRDDENHTKWHNTYQVDEEWIKKNKNDIDDFTYHTELSYNQIMKLDIDCLRTTYDGIYENKTDIDKLISYLEIPKPLHLDRLDKRHRLRNGDVGDKDYKINRTLI